MSLTGIHRKKHAPEWERAFFFVLTISRLRYSLAR